MRREFCVTFLSEINGNLKRRDDGSASFSLSLSFSFAEAIGILITRSVKIARNLGRVIIPKDAPPY